MFDNGGSNGARRFFYKNKMIINDRTRLLQEVRVFHKRYFSLRINNQDFMEPK